MVLTCHLLQPSPARLSWSRTDEENVVDFYEISSTKGNREAYSQHCGQKARSRNLFDKEGKKEHNSTRLAKCRGLSADWGIH